MFDSILIGLIQGLTEFFPVSSSAHVLIFEKILNFEQDNHSFAIAIHIATVLAAIIYFHKDIVKIIKSMLYLPGSCSCCRKMGYKIILATIPVLVIGYILERIGWLDKFETNLLWIGITLVLFGVLLYFADQRSSKLENKQKEEISYLDSLLIGASQIIAGVFPGTSRSGITLTTSFFRQIDRTKAGKFIFLLSIPVSAIPAIYEITKGDITVNTDFFAAFISAFLSGLFAIYFLFKLIKESSLKWFCYYRVVLGIGIIVYSLTVA